METSKNTRRRYWSAVLGWIGIIYSTLYVVRPVCTFLKRTTPFPLLVNIFCIILLIAVVTVIWRKSRALSPSSCLILTGVLSAYIYGLATIQFPEEKIHFIEYGFLAYLVFRAVRLDRPEITAYGIVFLLVSILGWIDEGIQHLLPNRYYQIEDVVLNSVSGVLGLCLVYIYQRSK